MNELISWKGVSECTIVGIISLLYTEFFSSWKIKNQKLTCCLHSEIFSDFERSVFWNVWKKLAGVRLLLSSKKAHLTKGQKNSSQMRCSFVFPFFHWNYTFPLSLYPSPSYIAARFYFSSLQYWQRNDCRSGCRWCIVKHVNLHFSQKKLHASIFALWRHAQHL